LGFDLDSYLRQQAAVVNAALERYLPAAEQQPTQLHTAMRYSVMAGGKRLRPILVLAAAQAIAGEPLAAALPAACALECIHTYSLIHDDLPAMDNDDYRRGMATNHKVFGEGLAILAGDALLTLGFEILTQHLEGFSAACKLQVIGEIACAAGSQGMVGGQSVDILWEKGQARDGEPTAALEYIHTHKTGALIVASVRTGALLAGASSSQLQALTQYAKCFGLAFQITDDLLDVFGDEAKVGKRLQKDALLGKLTYPAVYGVTEAQEEAQRLVAAAVASLASWGEEATPLRALAEYLVQREY